MVLILVGLVIAALPLVMTTAFTQLMLVSIYSGVVFLLTLAWALLVITIIARRHRIAEWRNARKLRKQTMKNSKALPG